MKKAGILLSLLLIGLILFGCQSNKTDHQEQNKTVDSTAATRNSSRSEVPTLFIHGYSGGKSSFGHLIKRLEAADKGQKELVLTVAADGQVTAAGQLSGKKNNPLIQVLFSDNQNNEWNQSEWIKNCLVFLQDHYGTQTVNLVGHSMGGVSGLRYLGNYGSDQKLPKVVKFAALGAPFNDFLDTSGSQTLEELDQNGPTEVSGRYQDYQNLAGNIAKETKIFIGAGQLSENQLTDGTVPLTSALAVTRLLKDQQLAVTTKIYHGVGAQHSGLHENEEVDQDLADFLWPK